MYGISGENISMSLRYETSPHNTLTLFFTERLDIDHVTKLWQSSLDLINKHRPATLILELSDVDYCDVAGVTLLQALRKKQAQANPQAISSEIQHLKPELAHLFDHIEKQQDSKTAAAKSKQTLLEYLGHFATNIVSTYRDNIAFIGLLTNKLTATFSAPKKVRWRDFGRVIEDAGPRSLGIVSLIGFLIGLISTFQAAPSFGEFGAQIFMVNLVSLGLVREMGPLLTAVLLAGRTASSFAAELGTMKINREIDALETMGINPIRFLVVPRVLSAMLITPLLEAFLIFCGLIGCFVVMSSLGYTLDAFWNQLSHAITPGDVLGGIAKVFVFGMVIAAIGCMHGLKTGSEAQAVGRSTTQAVVSSLIMLVVVDGIFAIVYYVLDF
jgi:phospholipid/cholesterol/gamma-HCH transport system permease protein